MLALCLEFLPFRSLILMRDSFVGFLALIHLDLDFLLRCDGARLKKWVHHDLDQVKTLVRLICQHIGDQIFEQWVNRQWTSILLK